MILRAHNIWRTIICSIAFILVLAQAEPININTASKEEITKNLNGIGAVKADAIIQFREKNGDFTKAEDLLKVSGIGEKSLAKFKQNLLFDAKSTSPMPDEKTASGANDKDSKIQKDPKDKKK